MLFAYLLLIGPLYLIGMWLGEDPRTNTINIHVLNGSDHVFKVYDLLQPP